MQEPVTVVLVKKSGRIPFPKITNLKSIVEQSKLEFKADKHHIFLFPENYSINAGGRTHKSNKALLEAVKKALPEKWALAFSHNETTSSERLSNTGYLITHEGHQAQPKRTLTQLDRAIIKYSGGGQKNKNEWHRRSVRFKKVKFPRLNFNGIEFEHRVCADAKLPHDGKTIVLVSAHRLSASKNAEGMPNTTIIHDGYESDGSFLVHEGKGISLNHGTLPKANSILANKGIKIKLFNLKPQH